MFCGRGKRSLTVEGNNALICMRLRLPEQASEAKTVALRKGGITGYRPPDTQTGTQGGPACHAPWMN